MEVPAFKSFVSEEELDDKRKKRQEEWEKVRKPDDPEEAPEEAYDGRPLFYKLQEQKMKKDAELEEQFRLSNQVKGLEEDEAEFLDECSNRQNQVLKRRYQEDSEVLNEFQKSVVQRGAAHEPSLKDVVMSQSKQKVKPEATGKKTSQMHLLQKAIKRKSADTMPENGSDAKKHSTTLPNSNIENEIDTKIESDIPLEVKVSDSVGLLPGIGAYSDSDRSTSSDESES